MIDITLCKSGDKCYLSSWCNRNLIIDDSRFDSTYQSYSYFQPDEGERCEGWWPNHHSLSMTKEARDKIIELNLKLGIK